MCLSERAASERNVCYKFGASVPSLNEHVWCWSPLTISSIFLLIFLDCFSGTSAHPWSCKLQFFLPLGCQIHCTLVLKSFFFLFFFSCECMCTPICKLMWAYCSLHSGSAWGLGPREKGTLPDVVHTALQQGLLLNAWWDAVIAEWLLVSSCKISSYLPAKDCAYYNSWILPQVAVAAAQTVVLSRLVFLLNPGPSIIVHPFNIFLISNPHYFPNASFYPL